MISPRAENLQHLRDALRSMSAAADVALMSLKTPALMHLKYDHGDPTYSLIMPGEAHVVEKTMADVMKPVQEAMALVQDVFASKTALPFNPEGSKR